MVACFTSTIAITRIALAGGPPNVKPVAFLSILSGIISGPLFGFLVGSLGMAVSDLFFGVGPWTLVTSLGMGLIGLLGGAAIHWNAGMSRPRLAILGFLLTILYDLSTSILLALMFGYSWWLSVLLLYLPFAGGVAYPFGFVHELTTAILLSLAGPPLIRQSKRFMTR
jgi:energy-coupling factor transport system substrate-specific component